MIAGRIPRVGTPRELRVEFPSTRESAREHARRPPGYTRAGYHPRTPRPPGNGRPMTDLALLPASVASRPMHGLLFDAQERRGLCDILDEIGPSAPTLLDGWNTHDLAAHIVLRERDLVA